MKDIRYRPTVEDMTDDSRWQKLSCREGGKFDAARNWWKVKDSARRAAAKTRGEAS